jgi:hypothetical protein
MGGEEEEENSNQPAATASQLWRGTKSKGRRKAGLS